MRLLAHDDADWGSAKQSIGFDVPASLLEDAVTGGGEGREVGYGCARHETSLAISRQVQ